MILYKVKKKRKSSFDYLFRAETVYFEVVKIILGG